MLQMRIPCTFVYVTKTIIHKVVKDKNILVDHINYSILLKTLFARQHLKIDYFDIFIIGL